MEHQFYESTRRIQRCHVRSQQQHGQSEPLRITYGRASTSRPCRRSIQAVLKPSALAGLMSWNWLCPASTCIVKPNQLVKCLVILCAACAGLAGMHWQQSYMRPAQRAADHLCNMQDVFLLHAEISLQGVQRMPPHPRVWLRRSDVLERISKEVCITRCRCALVGCRSCCRETPMAHSFTGKAAAPQHKCPSHGRLHIGSCSRAGTCAVKMRWKGSCSVAAIFNADARPVHAKRISSQTSCPDTHRHDYALVKAARAKLYILVAWLPLAVPCGLLHLGSALQEIIRKHGACVQQTYDQQGVFDAASLLTHLRW